jgi:hypothetical protein
MQGFKAKALKASGRRIKTAGEGKASGNPHEPGGGNITGGKFGKGFQNKGLGSKVKSGKAKSSGGY